jgi:hypothetical protein
MTTQLRWHVGLGSAWIYAATRENRSPADAQTSEGESSEEAVAAGETAPTRFAAEVAALGSVLTAEGIEPLRFLAQFAAFAPTCDVRRDLAHKTLTKRLGRAPADRLTPLVVGPLGACEREYVAANPGILDELRLRTGPLRELWEARGPGLLAGVGRRTDKSLIVEFATVALVPPLTGVGGGSAFAATNVVEFEAVLANPIDALPETVRLAWLTSQLAADQIEFLTPLASGSAQDVVAAAMLPAVLEAAADLELVGADDATLLDTAAAAWDVALLTEPGRVDVLRTWWRLVRGNSQLTSLPWNGRLLALDRMLIGNFGEPPNE